MANYSSSHTGAEIDSAVGRLKSTAVTAGTVAASSGVCVDSNKDITGFRNITGTGTATFANFVGTGNIDIGDAAGDTVTITAQVDSNVVPSADNTYDLGSSTKEWKDIYIDGTAYLDAINFNGTAITSTAAELNILDGVTSTAAELNILDGVTSTAAEINILDGVTSTATELNIMDGGTSATSTTLADADRVVVNDGGTMKQVALTDFETYFESALDTLSNVTSVGTLTSFRSTGIDDNADALAITIDSSERVGIGMTDPDNPLEVLAIEGKGIKLASSHDGSVLASMVEEGTAGRIRVSDAGTTKVQIEATANASSYINNGGNFGIGNASPQAKLHVSGGNFRFQYDQNDWSDFAIYNEDTGTGAHLQITARMKDAGGNAIIPTKIAMGKSDNTDGAADGFTAIYSMTNNSLAETMRVVSGKVGVGTTSPSTVLSVISDSDSTELGFNVKHSNLSAGISIGYQRIKAYGTDTNQSMYIDGKGTGNLLLQSVATGKVGIGTSSVDEVLHVYGTSNPAIKIEAPSGQRPQIISESGDATECQILFNQGATTHSMIQGGCSGNQTLKFYTGGTTLGMTIDASQNLTLGGDEVKLQNPTNGGTTDLILENYDQNLTDASDVQGKITMSGRYWTGDATSQLVKSEIRHVKAASNGNGGSELHFCTQSGGDAPSSKLVIASDGDVGVGTSPGNALHVLKDDTDQYISVMQNQSSSAPYGLNIHYGGSDPDGAGSRFFACTAGSTVRMWVLSDGDVQNHDNSYGSTSDERIKQDIKDANSQWDDIKALKVRNFKKNDDVRLYGDKAWEQIGVVAQELEESGMDKLVKEYDATDDDIKNNKDIKEGDKVKTVKYSVLYMKAIKCLQEAMEKIETLETKVTALEAK